MKRIIAACAAALLLSIADANAAGPSATAGPDAKVANFSLPGIDRGSPAFERLAFWSGPRGNAVQYGYGADERVVQLQPLGPSRSSNGFAVRFPNGLVLDVVPRGDALLVSDRAGGYRKTFEWQYEGPVDGRGTFCAPCVDEDDAVEFVRERFMN